MIDLSLLRQQPDKVQLFAMDFLVESESHAHASGASGLVGQSIETPFGQDTIADAAEQGGLLRLTIKLSDGYVKDGIVDGGPAAKFTGLSVTVGGTAAEPYSQSDRSNGGSRYRELAFRVPTDGVGEGIDLSITNWAVRFSGPVPVEGYPQSCSFRPKVDTVAIRS